MYSLEPRIDEDSITFFFQIILEDVIRAKTEEGKSKYMVTTLGNIL